MFESLATTWRAWNLEQASGGKYTIIAASRNTDRSTRLPRGGVILCGTHLLHEHEPRRGVKKDGALTGLELTV